MTPMETPLGGGGSAPFVILITRTQSLKEADAADAVPNKNETDRLP